MTTFDSRFLDRFTEIEDRHFWFRARNRIIGAAAARLTAGLPAGYRVLEVGCGTGVVLAQLERSCPAGRVVGMDLYHNGLVHARRRTKCPLVQGDIHHLPFAPGFHLVGIFDVLEHIPDDRAILSRLFELTLPGGAVLLTVPAHQSLWSYFDEAAFHCRRYEAAQLRERLTSAGFVVEHLTEFMAATYPLVWLQRKVSSWRRRSGDDPMETAFQMTSRELSIVPVVNGALELILRAEARLLTALWARGRSLPLGTSLMAVARRPRLGNS